jgi:hypothetical protein
MEVHYMFTGAIMVRKEAAGSAFRFPEDLRIAEDWECFARLAQLGPTAYLDCELAVQVGHQGPRLTGTRDIEQATARITVLQRIWGTDEAFLTAHSARYQSVLKAQYLRRARLLIVEGQLEASTRLGPTEYSPASRGLLSATSSRLGGRCGECETDGGLRRWNTANGSPAHVTP